MEVDAETHSQASGKIQEFCGNVEDKSEQIGDVKNITRGTTETTRLGMWTSKRPGLTTKKHASARPRPPTYL